MTTAIRDTIYRKRRFQPDIIELCVRWYITYRVSYYRSRLGRGVRSIGILIIALALSMVGAQAGAEDSKDNPPDVRPWTGTVKELRAVAARAADTAGDYLDEGHDWLYRRLQYSIEDVDTWFAERDIVP